MIWLKQVFIDAIINPFFRRQQQEIHINSVQQDTITLNKKHLKWLFFKPLFYIQAVRKCIGPVLTLAKVHTNSQLCQHYVTVLQNRNIFWLQ